MSVAKHKSITVSKKSDQRQVRTRQQLDSAFVELLHRRAYDSIRVSDITKKAKVGRATFYAHYAGKHELLQSQLARIVTPMLRMVSEPYLLDATLLFTHVGEARRIYRSLMIGASAQVAARIVQDCFEARVVELLQGRQLDDLPLSLTARFVASSLVALVGWWIDHELQMPPQQLQAVFASLVGDGLRASLT